MKNGYADNGGRRVGSRMTPAHWVREAGSIVRAFRASPRATHEPGTTVNTGREHRSPVGAAAKMPVIGLHRECERERQASANM